MTRPGIQPGPELRLCQRLRRSVASESEHQSVTRDSERKLGFGVMRTMAIFVACLVLFSVLFSVSMVLNDPPSDAVLEASGARSLRLQPNKVVDSEDKQSDSVEEITVDRLYNGLLASGFDENSCLSRYQSAFYRKGPHRRPSPHLVSRLRSYEALHKRCGPYTKAYNESVEMVKSGRRGSSECNYLVWVSFSGLGNRILTLASAFLYALLTDRVLLVDPGVDMKSLFCEPFPEVSWFLPADFPIGGKFAGFNQANHESYGAMLKKKNESSVPDHELEPRSYLYLHLVHDYDFHDKLFFCEQDQIFFRKIPWLIMKTDNYFAPSLFLVPAFEQDLMNLFPNKELVFHFLGRYLLHPTNKVWGLITRYYNAYLANSDERIGIQIRVFDIGTGPFQHVLDQILACTSNENLLPRVTDKERFVDLPKPAKSRAVLITSLSGGYFEKIRDMYWENPTVTGEVVGVFQPSHEEHQQTGKETHNQKALAEMYLLSLTDVLVTSSWSTFGYVAQSLGGVRPWILQKPENRTVPEPACRHGVSMEPCFHAPPFYDCKAKGGVDTGKLVPHVRHCEDMSWGLKLVDQ